MMDGDERLIRRRWNAAPPDRMVRKETKNENKDGAAIVNPPALFLANAQLATVFHD
jgi:hypothetical protein